MRGTLRHSGLSLAVAAAAGLAVSSGAQNAQAGSAGCDALEALGTLNTPVPSLDLLGGGQTFDAGEIVTMTVDTTGGSTLSAVGFGLADAATSTVLIGANASQSSFSTQPVQSISAVSPGGSLIVTTGFAFLSTVFVTFSCSEGSASSDADESQLDAQSLAAAQAAIQQSAGLTLNRLRSFQRGTPSDRAGRTVQADAAAGSGLASAGRGASGQAGETPIGVWGDFSWTGLENNSAAVDSNTDAFTISGGIDAALSDSIVFGASLSVGRAFSEVGNDAIKTTETSVSVTPYFAYQIDERFSVQGLVGYGHGSGSSDRGGVTGDYDAHRYFMAIEGALFETWGDAALYAGVGVLYGRSHRLRFTESDGTRVGSQRVDIGAANVILQPSYMLSLDDDEGLFLEPFATFDYSYDFDITKIAGAANDRDAFRVGAGAYLYAGDAISGTVEATRMLGREDEDETSARMTVRVDF